MKHTARRVAGRGTRVPLPATPAATTTQAGEPSRDSVKTTMKGVKARETLARSRRS
ncbi:hypothetical protein GCM10023074_11860 [Microbispora amethystogenes]|uniref:Uncharacterized protein n=1 Tax=Microbispora amethystogenes TaxID=1427754 RepID=A0ABQ4FKJ4_9ACTN|nr:hypothetical protein Mam01_55000 [Microbispora amethystogenes]